MKTLFQNRTAGFGMTFLASCLAAVGAVAYLIAYVFTIDPVTGAWDRVFRWAVFFFMLGGAAVSFGGEFLRLHAAPIAAIALYGVGLSMHLVQAAYPVADVLTGVKFFGGNAPLAIVFSAIFGIAVLLHVVGAFSCHEQAV